MVLRGSFPGIPMSPIHLFISETIVYTSDSSYAPPHSSHSALCITVPLFLKHCYKCCTLATNLHAEVSLGHRTSPVFLPLASSKPFI